MEKSQEKDRKERKSGDLGGGKSVQILVISGGMTGLVQRQGFLRGPSMLYSSASNGVAASDP